MTLRGRLRGTAAAALLALAAPVALPVVTPAAYAQETGTITVDLVESVGADWFSEIGDRDVVLRRIDGIDPTTAAGQAKLGELDIPALVRGGAQFEQVDRATTAGGKAQFTGVAQGVYLVETLDSAGTRDARVSYSPAVVAVAPGSASGTIAPKAQVLGAAANPVTACTAPGWLDASAPGTYLEYDYAFNVPNPSTDGTISSYEVSFTFSPGHTVQWDAETSTSAPWWRALIPESRNDGAVVKLTRPTLTLVGAGKSTELREGADYTIDVQGNDNATFTLTADGRQALADVRAVDPNTRLEVHVPALTNSTGPWGTVSRGEVLGTLETTATLRTDGMDALRTPVEVSHTSHVNVISRRACVVNPGSDGGSGAPGGSTGGSGAPGSSGSGATGGEGQPEQPSQPGQSSAGDVAGSDGQRGGGAGQRSGLASTGAGVLGITGIALLLIALGVVMRRRDRKEEPTQL